MLSSLHIENIAVIKELDLTFPSGFSVLTGQTGAGKSVIIDSVRLLLGARGDKDLIRAGEEQAMVEGLFCALSPETLSALAEKEIAPDENGELLLSRVISSQGRSLCRINGRSVPQTALRAAGSLLIGIHGQHDTQTLLSEESHPALLDRYGACAEALAKYQAAYGESVALKGRLTALLKEEEQREYLQDKYARALKEISGAGLKPNEEEALETRKKLVKDAQKLAKQSRIVYRALYKNEKGGSAADLIEIAGAALEQLSDAIDESEEYAARLTAVRLDLIEIAEAAAAVAQSFSDDPAQELNRIEDRLDLIRSLKKRYGPTEEEVVAFGEKAKRELEELKGRDGALRQLREELEESVLCARRCGAELTALRRAAARKLEDAVNAQLGYLDLEKVIFRVEITEEKTASGTPKLSPGGIDTVRFLLSSNPGEPFRPLSEIASGGELSRIMLALKVALSDKELTPTLIFDEIDTGISGRTSQKIGLKLREIAAYTQVLCVTHSAQVAACAARHFRITKSEVQGRNRTEVTVLDGQERVEELSRILGGIRVTDAVRANARELLRSAQKETE